MRTRLQNQIIGVYKISTFFTDAKLCFFFFVVVRCEQNPTHIHTFVVCGVTCLSQDVKKIVAATYHGTLQCTVPLSNT